MSTNVKKIKRNSKNGDLTEFKNRYILVMKQSLRSTVEVLFCNEGF